MFDGTYGNVWVYFLNAVGRKSSFIDHLFSIKGQRVINLFDIKLMKLLTQFSKDRVCTELLLTVLQQFSIITATRFSPPINTQAIQIKGNNTQIITEDILILSSLLVLPFSIQMRAQYIDLYNIQLLMSNQQKQDNEEIMINTPEGFDAPLFCWDVNKTSPKIKLDPECLRAKSTEGNGFKTTMGTEIFTEGGRYYFQIFINKGQLIKIGVCRPSITNLEEAFSDGVHGWAIYNGQTRHNSNSTGPNYGSPLVTGDIIGVALDMVQGTLGYYRNETYWGVAFKDEELKKGEMVASVSPIYNNDTFTLRNMIKQD